MKKRLIILTGLLFMICCVHAQERGLVNPKAVFIEKGTKSAGLSFGWNSWDASGDDGVDLMGLISGLEGSVNQFDISAVGSWFIKDNMSVGIMIGYADTRVAIDSVRLLGNDENDRHLIRESLSGSVTFRQYLPLFNGKIMALFYEGRLSGRTGFYKNYQLTVNGKEGTYSDLGRVSMGVYPGVSVFATQNISFELSLPVFELGYNWQDESGTDSDKALLNHGFVRFRPGFTGLKMGMIFHF